MWKRLLPPLAAIATATGLLLAMPGMADAAPVNPCAPGFELLPSSILCTPDPAAAVAPAPADPVAPAPHRSLLDRLLGRNRPAPVTPAPGPAAPAPAAPAPGPVYNPPPTTAPAQREQPPIVPLEILPPPGTPLPLPSERTVWLHTCVDLYVADAHLLQIDNQQLDIPPLAYVLFQCSTNPNIIPLIPINPGPVVPGQPPSAGSQIVFGPNVPVTH